MRFFILFLSFLFLSCSTKAQNGVDDNQIVNPAEWSYKVVAKGEETFEVTIKGKLKKGFHIYSQFIGEGGPIPLMLEFEKKAGVKLVGKL